MKKILALIIDGFGESDKEEGNAIKKAHMPNFDTLLEKYPHSLLEASGEAVGLPDGQAGNEEVGYETIGTGTKLKQRSAFVHDFVDKDNLATNTAIKNVVEHVKKHKSTIHVVGLMSDGGKNSNIVETIAMLKYFKSVGVNVVVDFISDGEDVEEKSVLKYIQMIEEIEVPIVSLCGRYYAMDEDGKWDRTKIYYDLIRNGIGLKVKELRLALKNCYIRNITDKFIPPIIVEPDKNIKDNDCIIWTNYGETGSKQILLALTNTAEVREFQTRPLINIETLLMYPVDPKVNGTVLINEEDDTSSSLGIYLSKLGLTQARIAVPSKYEYVTYYFNGGIETKLPKCNNYSVDVPKIAADKQINLESAAITKQIIKCMEKDTDFILASFDGPDKVGHTGNFDETVTTLEFLDECIARIVESAELNFYTIFIVSNHGNVESMLDENNNKITTHTANKVPFIVTDPKIKLIDGDLTGIAPTILTYMDISIPETMKTSKILIKE